MIGPAAPSVCLLNAPAEGRLDAGLIQPRPSYAAGVAAGVIHREALCVALAADNPLARSQTQQAADLATRLSSSLRSRKAPASEATWSGWRPISCLRPRGCQRNWNVYLRRNSVGPTRQLSPLTTEAVRKLGRAPIARKFRCACPQVRQQ